MSTESKAEKEFQEAIARFRNYQAQAEAIAQQMAVVQGSVDEHNKAMTALDAIKALEKGAELLVPVGANCQIHASLGRNDRVIVSLGADVSVERAPDDAAAILKKRRDELEGLRTKLAEALGRIEEEMQKLQAKLSSQVQQ